MIADRPALCESIRELRRLNGMSQSVLAERADLSIAALGRIERGQVQPRPATLRNLAHALGVDVKVLTEGLHDQVNAGHDAAAALFAEFRALTADATPLVHLRVRSVLRRIADDVIVMVA